MFEKTYTVQEFLKLEQDRQLAILDKTIGHIRRNKKIYRQLIVIIAIIGLTTGISFAGDLSNIDVAGNRILTVVKKIGYWIILIKCISDLIQQAMRGDLNSVGKTIATYVLIYGALFFVPWALRLVEGVF